MRHDLFLVFGFWHAYQYAHIALWNEFRHTFLAPVFFTLFPDEELMQRPDYPKAPRSSLGCGCRILALEMTFVPLEEP